MILAHIAGMPVEELLPSAASAGGSLLAARVWLALWLRRREREEHEPKQERDVTSSDVRT